MYASRCGRGRRRCAPPALVSSRLHCALRAVVSRGIAAGLSVRWRPAHRRCVAKNECAGLALHEHCATWVPAPRSRISSPFKARRAVRPSAASGRPVRLGTRQVRSSLEPRAMSRARLCLAGQRQSRSSAQQALRCGPVWLPSANARRLLPRLAVAQPVDRADVLKRAAHALARPSSPTLEPTTSS